jgi:hypothetical protein
MQMPFSDDWSLYFRLLHAIEQKGLLVNRADLQFKVAGSLGLLTDKVLLGPPIDMASTQKHDPDNLVCFRSAIVTTRGIGLVGFVTPIDPHENLDSWTVIPLTPSISFVPYAEWPATVQVQILRHLVNHIRHLTRTIRELSPFRDFL